MLQTKWEGGGLGQCMRWAGHPEMLGLKLTHGETLGGHGKDLEQTARSMCQQCIGGDRVGGMGTHVKWVSLAQQRT